MPRKATKTKPVYTEAFKKYIQDMGFICRRTTFNGEYDIAYIFCDEEHEDESDSDTTTFMTININPVYLYATIRIYPICMDKFREKRYRVLGESLLHEHCHILLEPLIHEIRGLLSSNAVSALSDTAERQTQRICNSIDGGLPEDWYTPRNVKTLMNQ